MSEFGIFVQYILDVDAIAAMIELLLCEGVRHRRKSVGGGGTWFESMVPMRRLIISKGKVCGRNLLVVRCCYSVFSLPARARFIIAWLSSS